MNNHKNTDNDNFAKDFYGFIIGRASIEMGRRLAKLFRESNHPITIEQFSILVHLWNKDGLNQNELSCLSGKDNPSICRLLDNLEKSNIIVRVPSETDRRTNLIYLTKLGKDLEESSKHLAMNTLDQSIDGISCTEMSSCMTTLSKIIDNLHKEN